MQSNKKSAKYGKTCKVAHKESNPVSKFKRASQEQHATVNKND